MVDAVLAKLITQSRENHRPCEKGRYCRHSCPFCHTCGIPWPCLTGELSNALEKSEENADRISRTALDLLSGGCNQHGSLSFEEFLARGGNSCSLCITLRAERLERDWKTELSHCEQWEKKFSGIDTDYNMCRQQVKELKKYTQHKLGCDYFNIQASAYYGELPCTCGLHNALNQNGC